MFRLNLFSGCLNLLDVPSDLLGIRVLQDFIQYLEKTVRFSEIRESLYRVATHLEQFLDVLLLSVLLRCALYIIPGVPTSL